MFSAQDGRSLHRRPGSPLNAWLPRRWRRGPAQCAHLLVWPRVPRRARAHLARAARRDRVHAGRHRRPARVLLRGAQTRAESRSAGRRLPPPASGSAQTRGQQRSDHSSCGRTRRGGPQRRRPPTQRAEWCTVRDCRPNRSLTRPEH